MKTDAQLIEWVLEARQRTRELTEDLSDRELMVPPLPTVNPLLWEIGHVAWFQEKWVLRDGGRKGSLHRDADALYDSAAVAHDRRWNLPLQSRRETWDYLDLVRDRVVEHLQGPDLSRQDVYFVLLSIFHEDMHAEALTYTRQTFGYRAPSFNLSRESAPRFEAADAHAGRDHPTAPDRAADVAGPLLGDVEVPGGHFLLGAAPDEPFVFDNEKWAHPVEVRPFAIARAPVTQAEYAAFVEDGGYRHERFWSDAGWRWRREANAEHPVYWQPQPSGSWLRRDFDRWLSLEPHRPMLHVNWYEADAYCRWAGRRLPTEVEWEVAAAAEPAPSRRELAPIKRRFPWGASTPARRHANLDWRAMGCVDVAALPEGDSALGCRQMIGNVWEWTADDFGPYPAFVVDPYQEYSAPWFGTHKVLRGGCWATRSRLLRNTWRNFYCPDRRDVFAGFRTCR
jgi:iron(II)-dependent oxidoreductase